MPPVWLTRALVGDALDRLLAGDDLGLECGQRRSLEAAGDADQEDDDEDRDQRRGAVGRQQGERHGAGRRGGARDEDDRAPVAPVGHVTTEQHQGERRDRLDQPEPAERERVAGDDVDLDSRRRSRARWSRGVVVKRAPRSARKSCCRRRGGRDVTRQAWPLQRASADRWTDRLSLRPRSKPHGRCRRPHPAAAAPRAQTRSTWIPFQPSGRATGRSDQVSGSSRDIRIPVKPYSSPVR